MMTTPLPKAPRPTHPETKPATEVEVVDSGARLERFLEVPGFVYWHDPYYVPPLRSADRRYFAAATNPFLARCEARLFLARHGHGRKPVARAAAAIDPDWSAKLGEKVGFFGAVEFLGDARLPDAVVGAALDWLRARGCAAAIGPCAFAPSHPGAGLLVEGFDDAPTVGTAYNPVNYPGFFARLPLEKWRDLHGFEIDPASGPPAALREAAAAARRDRGLAVRPLDAHAFDREVETIRTVLAEAYAASPLHVAFRPEEARFFFDALRRAIDPGLVHVLEAESRPVGVSVAIPDWNRVLKPLNGRLYPFGWLKALLAKRTIDRVRIAWFGIAGAARGGGGAAPLIEAAWDAVRTRGYRRIDISPIADDDGAATALLERLGARRTRTWRLFRAALRPRT